MQNRLKWVDGKCFIGETESGHSLVMDAGLDKGGRNRGARPMELLLMGAAACMSYDLVDILKKAQKDLRDCWADIKYERASEAPAVYTAIHFHFVLTGKSLKAEDVERALKLSAEKYCCASIMLGKTAQMTHSYELHELN